MRVYLTKASYTLIFSYVAVPNAAAAASVYYPRSAGTHVSGGSASSGGRLCKGCVVQ